MNTQFNLLPYQKRHRYSRFPKTG